MAWLYQYRIAKVVVQVDSDSHVCEHDMQKFLCLYEQVQGLKPDLTFRVLETKTLYKFVLLREHGQEEILWTSRDATEISAALEIHLYGQLVRLLDSRDIVSIHSAALNIDGCAVMFAGVSGAGKSSICTAGLLDGAAYLSDEFTLLDEQGLAHPFPRPMQWEHPTHPVFDRKVLVSSGYFDADYLVFPAATGETARCDLWHPRHVQRETLPLVAIVLHQYKEGVMGVKIQEIPRHEALVDMLKHLHIQHGLSKDLPRLNQRISSTCKFYRLYFSDVQQAWVNVKNRILQQL